MALKTLALNPTVKQIAAGADGAPPTGGTDLYEVPDVKSTVVKSISVVNTSSSAQTFNLYVLPGGVLNSARRLTPGGVQLAPGAQAIYDTEITLYDGDKIHADASTASVLDVTVSGVERDV